MVPLSLPNLFANALSNFGTAPIDGTIAARSSL